jgi:two-component system sensor histidine kinase CiaH
MLSRRDGTQIDVQLEELPFVSFFEGIGKDYAQLAQMEEKTFHFVVEGDASAQTKVAFDPKLLQQLSVILLDNALKYTVAGEAITLAVGVTKQEYSFSVKDTGVGISDDAKDAIFERFVRLDASRNRKTGGFGLGLPIAKQIVQAMNGKIVVVDNLPRGTIFKVIVPKAKTGGKQ